MKEIVLFFYIFLILLEPNLQLNFYLHLNLQNLCINYNTINSCYTGNIVNGKFNIIKNYNGSELLGPSRGPGPKRNYRCYGHIQYQQCILKLEKPNPFIIMNRETIESTKTENGIQYQIFKFNGGGNRIYVTFNIPSFPSNECENNGNLLELKYKTENYIWNVNSINSELNNFNTLIIEKPSSSFIIVFVENSNYGPLKGSISINNDEVIYNQPYEFKNDGSDILVYNRPDSPRGGLIEYVNFYIKDNTNKEISNESEIKINVCQFGCSCNINTIQKCDECLTSFYTLNGDKSDCKTLEEIKEIYPDLIGIYQSSSKSYDLCGRMCKDCSIGPDLNHNIHNCDICRDGYIYSANVNSHRNCYNIPCNQVNSNYREIENTHECLLSGCSVSYPFDLNNEKCFSICPFPYLKIDDQIGGVTYKKCVEKCDIPFPYHDINGRRCNKESCAQNDLYDYPTSYVCIDDCIGFYNYKFINKQNTLYPISKCVHRCEEPKIFHFEGNVCLDECPNTSPYYIQPDLICLNECPPNYNYFQDKTNECLKFCPYFKIESLKTCYDECPNSHPLYLSTTNECVHDCTPELPYNYNNKCISNCRLTDKIFIAFDKCVINCKSADLVYYDPDDLRCY